MTEKSAKYIKWKLDRSLEAYKADREDWFQKNFNNKVTCRELRERVKVLEEQLQTVKKKNTEQAAKIVQLETDNDRKDKEISVLKKRNYIIDEKHVKVTEEFRDDKEIFEKQYEALKQEHEELKVRTQADFDNIQRIAQHYEGETGNLQQAVTTLDREYRELKQRHKNLVGRLEHFLATEEDERRKQMWADLGVRISLVNDHEIQKEKYERKIKDLQEEIKVLQHLKGLNRVIENLKSTVEDKCVVIKNKNIEIAALKKEKTEVAKCWHNEQNKTAIFNVQQKITLSKIKRLEEKMELEEVTYQSARKDMDYYKGHNNFLTEKVSELKMQLKGTERHAERLQEQIQVLKTYQQRFKEDLQTCMPLIDEPKQLKQRVIDLKRVYSDDDNSVQLGKYMAKMYQFKFECAQRELEGAERVKKINATIRKRLEDQLESVTRVYEAKEIKYIRKLNDEIERTFRLKKELNYVKLKLEKATKSPNQKVKSWMNKKVLRKVPAIQQVEEEKPPLYCKALEPPVWKPNFAEEDFLTWEDLYFEDTLVHQNVEPCLPVSVRVTVKPKEDVGLPPVDN